MSTTQRGRSAVMRFGFQSDFATEAAAATHFLNYYSEGLDSGEALQDDPLIRGDIHNARDMTDPSPTLPQAAGQLVTQADFNGLSLLLPMLFGPPAEEGSGPYTRTFISGREDLAFGSAAFPLDPTRFKVAEGLTASSWDFSLAKEAGFKQMTVGFEARRVYTSGASGPGILTGTPAALTPAPMVGTIWSILINDVAAGRIREGSFSYQNTLERENFADGERFPGGMFPGDASTTVNATLRLSRLAAQNAFIDLFNGQTPFKLTLVAQSGANSLTLTLPRCFGENRSPVIGGTGPVEFSAGIRASQTPTAPALTAVLVNAIAPL